MIEHLLHIRKCPGSILKTAKKSVLLAYIKLQKIMNFRAGEVAQVVGQLLSKC
jgi:hypothetical protein